MVAFLLSCKSSAEYSKSKSKTADPEAPRPHPSPLQGRMKNNTHSKSPTKTRFSQSLQLNKIQVSEAQALLQGLCTSARNTEIRGFLTIWLPWWTQGRSTPTSCSCNIWKLQPKPPLSRKRGKPWRAPIWRGARPARAVWTRPKSHLCLPTALPDRSKVGGSTAPGSSHWPREHLRQGKGKAPVFT